MNIRPLEIGGAPTPALFLPGEGVSNWKKTLFCKYKYKDIEKDKDEDT